MWRLHHAASGAVNYWVKMPLLSHTTDTTICLCYGNSSITSDQSNKTTVWDANYTRTIKAAGICLTNSSRPIRCFR